MTYFLLSYLVDKHNMDKIEHIRSLCNNPNNLVLMYIGNLESYQGIGLLLNSFKLVCEATDRVELFIIGGESADIKSYTLLSERIGISTRVHFLGPRPVKSLSQYLEQADILVSPRIKGKNTPMKIYSYLGSGRAVVATNLETHTQVLTDQVAVLADPNPDQFAEGILALVQDTEMRERLGKAGKELVDEQFSLAAFKKRANRLLDEIQV